MAWARLEDGFFTDPRVVGLSKDAKLFHLAALTYCARELTDGLVPVQSWPIIAAMAGVRSPGALVPSLVSAGLWMQMEDGHQIHKFLEYNPTREHVLGERQAARERMANRRRSSGNVRANTARSSEEVRIPPSPTPVGGSKEPLAPNGAVAREAIPKPKHLPVDEAFVEALVTEFGSWARDSIANALNYKKRTSYDDQRLFVRNWVKRDAEKHPGNVTPVNGAMRPRPIGALPDVPADSPFLHYGSSHAKLG